MIVDRQSVAWLVSSVWSTAFTRVRIFLAPQRTREADKENSTRLKAVLRTNEPRSRNRLTWSSTWVK
jgi:hypothetical protein